MKKYVFELTADEIDEYCQPKEDCMFCKLYYKYGICAKDLVTEGDYTLKDLLAFLLREVEYEYSCTITRKVEQQEQRGYDESQSKCDR